VTPALRRRLGQAVVLATVVLLALLARRIAWAEVLTSLRATPAHRLVAAGLIALGGHLIYASFDLLGRRYTRHALPIRQTVPVTFICYAFNLNLGAWLGSIALRYRLYARLGLTASTITKILSLSLMTNWLGYLALGGVVFASGQVHLAGDWALSAIGLRLLGLVLLALAIGYLAICLFARRRVWRVRGRDLALPGGRLAVLQVVLGACSWSAMALVIHVLLAGRIEFPTVLGVLLVSAIAGVASHIPAGLGVLEAVFLGLLGDRVPSAQLLAALLGYRALYFLLPLAIATVLFAGLELRSRRTSRPNGGVPVNRALQGAPPPADNA
jgi:uncharacterized membrane protein YbhN (UPF0104 family)